MFWTEIKDLQSHCHFLFPTIPPTMLKVKRLEIGDAKR